MAYDDVFVGQILMCPFNFPPKGFAFCHGQIMNIGQNTALFSLLGTTYGGNGVSTFALPDLRGRVPLQAGQGPGLSDYGLGEQGGSERVAVTTAQIPPHTHTIDTAQVKATARARSGPANQPSPVGNVPAVESTLTTYSDLPPDSNMHPAAITVAGAVTIEPSGSNEGHENRQPFLTISFCIALQGIYPPRS